MCHGHAGTIVVAKVAGTDEIIGGYNPLPWDKSSRKRYMKTNDSFIFSLKNGNFNSILSRVKDSKYALYYRDSNVQNIYGPEFGDCCFTMESVVSNFTQDKLCWCDTFSTYYEKPIRKTNKRFSIVDYEVFKIIKKQIPIR
ncbi:hypothetical protein Glove_87g150 [Diversispora epigaea]|uniref:TLDc domain-containing protein n=1 Tax=Diversispora epigaea TaxID=1348612 RepID=A0A397J6X9_9GLOM|nr:hypothetical protein Glove_87g150 [Diversispora epigaea]